MRAGHAIFGFALLGVCTLGGAEVPIEFSGVLTTEGKAKVALTDKTNRTTHWLEPGDDFLGYAIARYDPKEDAVILRKDGQEYRLLLIPSKTVDAQPAAAPTALAAPVREFTANAIRSNLRQFVAAARRFQAEHGVASVSFADIVGPGKLIRELTPVAGENYTTLTYAPNVTALSVSAIDGTNVTLDVTAPPAALGALSASTPPGTPPPATAPAETVPPVTPPPATPPATTPPPVDTPAIPPTSTPATPAAPAPNEPATSPTPSPSADASVTPPPTATAPRTPDAGDALAPAGSTHTVQTGDTLSSIARTNGLTVEQLQGMNPTVNASSLQPGQAIRIR